MVSLSTRLSETISRDASASSLDLPNASFSGIQAEPRRTRKRITPSQLEQLEELYRQSSHPTREQRDALGRRIQMYAYILPFFFWKRSLTTNVIKGNQERYNLVPSKSRLWFFVEKMAPTLVQNKRQTDRKVALHKATHSRAVPANDHAEKGRSKDECIPKASEVSTSLFKRTSSYASSVSSVSSTSSKSKRPSLDRVASRSEIRFINRYTPTQNDTISKKQGQTIPESSSSHRASPLISPVSPIHTSSALWSHMLSSPMAPSSPPPVELVAYSRTRKTRTLDWACTVARLSAKEDGFPEGNLDSTLKPAFDISKQDIAMSEREYEDAIATTEDEDELVTPQASQTTLVSWPHKDPCHVTVTREAGHNSTEDKVLSMSVIYEADDTHSLPKSLARVSPWQEDEMHAALALCGLRG